MHLRSKEVIRKVYHRHFFPYFLRLIAVLIASFPFYFIVFLLSASLDKKIIIEISAAVSLLFIGVIAYMSFIYWMDRLVVTNFRVIFIDWKLLNVSSESEAELEEIQDIHTKTKGIFSFIPFLNYGALRIETAASRLSVDFHFAPDPNAIKLFIFSVK